MYISLYFFYGENTDYFIFLFFQAEDGIRYRTVTGVQTCALPLTQRTRDAEVAQDLAQEAFLRLAREIEAGRQPRDTGAWLRRVGANLAASRGRHLQVVDRHAASLPRPA